GGGGFQVGRVGRREPLAEVGETEQVGEARDVRCAGVEGEELARVGGGGGEVEVDLELERAAQRRQRRDEGGASEPAAQDGERGPSGGVASGLAERAENSGLGVG